MKRILAAMTVLISFFVASIAASAADSNLFVDKNPSIYLFYMSDCPYSRDARQFLAKEAKKDERLRVVELNVDTSEAFQDLLQRVYERIGLPGLGVVPLIVVGDHFQIGYDGDVAGKQILSDVARCRESGCRDWVGEMMNELNQIATPVASTGRIAMPATLAIKSGAHAKAVKMAR
ncbi:MAG: glutaredoxin [Hyphomicrobiaceae bacterium]|nr:glutaredoxin [Hyphomicrobiaceae bacterium]